MNTGYTISKVKEVGTAFAELTLDHYGDVWSLWRFHQRGWEVDLSKTLKEAANNARLTNHWNDEMIVVWQKHNLGESGVEWESAVRSWGNAFTAIQEAKELLAQLFKAYASPHDTGRLVPSPIFDKGGLRR